MSPEQVRGEALDARTDLFSFGVVLFEMASGRLQFAGDGVHATFDNILHRSEQRLSDANPELPPGLLSIIHKALEKDREHRYQTAEELRDDFLRLKAALGSRSTSRTGRGVAAAL